MLVPLLARGKEVPLPKTKHHTEETDKNQPIIAINKKGEVYFDKEMLTQVVAVAPQPGQSGRAWQVKDAPILRRTLDDAWQQWIEFEREFQKNNLASIRQYPTTAPQDLTDRALGSVSRAFLDEDTGTLYAAFRYQGVVAHVGALSLEEKREGVHLVHQGSHLIFP